MVNDHEEGRLLEHARSFDRQALTEIYDAYQQPLYRYIYRQVGDVEVARDLTADVFQRFLQAIQKGRGPKQKLKAWLYRVAHNKVIDYYRRQQHRQHLQLNERIVENGENLSAVVDRNIASTQVRAALRQLTPDQQQVIALKFLEGLSNKEVADLLDKPVGAVKSLQHRALAALQRQLSSDQEQVLV
jgi:RNA polymerase sigma-70 factor (ECF subfamily)